LSEKFLHGDEVSNKNARVARMPYQNIVYAGGLISLSDSGNKIYYNILNKLSERFFRLIYNFSLRKSSISFGNCSWNFSLSNPSGSVDGRKSGLFIVAGNGLRNEK